MRTLFLKQQLGVVSLFILALGLSTPLLAASDNITGLWIMTKKAPKGMTIATLELTQHGTKVEGTMKPESGGEIPIENGLIKGNEITFSVTEKTEAGNRKTTYTGTATGDTIHGTFRQNDKSLEWTAKRSIYSGG